MLNAQNVTAANPRGFKSIYMSDEMNKIAEEYNLGKFRALEQDLETFIRQNRDKINKFKEAELRELKGVSINDELAVKMYILQTRCISHVTEIKLELDEIQKEIWYTGEKEKKPANREEVARRWCALHAPGWRDHWVMAALYIFEHNKERYLKILNEPTKS